MVRQTLDTPEGKLASERWKKTMLERYGGTSELARQHGAIGGRRGRGKGGFAANPELAKIAGCKGGRLSRRSGKVHKGKWAECKDAVFAEYKNNDVSMIDLAKKYDLPYRKVIEGIRKMEENDAN